MPIADPTKRFSDRVENYIKYRPSYPREVLTYLASECKLNTGSAVADIGSGTGIFSSLLLVEGYKVYAVEPNDPMQAAAIGQFGGDENFVPVTGTAEATNLPENSIDLIVCAQAFHWFDAEKTKTEFKRILKSGEKAALIWNNRDAGTDEFAAAYENLLKQDSVDYNNVNHRNISDINFKAFFKDGLYEAVKYPNVQVFDEERLLGRAFSSSYVPAEDTDEGKKFKDLLRALFAKYNSEGKVRFYYQTEVYLGKV
jgi:SAM-dependent methyltransferase